jgi:hypothetical protein
MQPDGGHVRAEAVEIAEQFIKDCPFYAAGTFAAVAAG